ncbi:hypothetical protein AVW11_27545 [Streptomyces amritsarensis]|uniref:Uncharacterized protein n=1 Tax=Streptomyces amritsarensis TaxID=681158 RepID=A0ABX3FVG5_9ACTN|nr:hypothetical protein [Streptomyces amritsarensis]OLZ58998.1 hypothetical protein AVW11_27545 [Streptomyces amritsarensis]
MEDQRGTGGRHVREPIGFDPEAAGAEPGESGTVTAAVVVEGRGGAGHDRRGRPADPGPAARAGTRAA